MTVQDLYKQIGGDYDEIVTRLGSEKFAGMFIVRFLNDKSCPNLIAAWKAGDEGNAFKEAHNAKGVCANLSLTNLCSLTTQICEALRVGNEKLRAQTNIDALIEELSDLYASTIESIQAFRDQ